VRIGGETAKFPSPIWATILASPERASPELASKGGKKAPGDGQGSGTAVITRTKTLTQRPSMYRVLLLNDDYTPMDFVVGVLTTYFHKNIDDAQRIMWQVHNNGVGECGVYTYEVADTKVTQVMDHARKHQHPLQCVMEKK
jgi:ATP-dependent Clp protease adaptor protein ClpS